MASSSDDTYFKFRPKGNTFLPEHYEGFLQPRTGRTPFKIIDDPGIIAKKNQMREALRDEFTRKIYNPYRWASGVGGHVFDPAIQRFHSMTRTDHHFVTTGPKMNFFGLAVFILVPYALWVVTSDFEIRREIRLRGGEVAYKDRRCKFST